MCRMMYVLTLHLCNDETINDAINTN